MAALLLAVRDRLRTALTLDNEECEVQSGPEPSPMAGELFLSVWDGGSNNQQDECLDERYALAVTVTMRNGFAPKDRWGTAIVAATSTGLLAFADLVKTAIHGKDAVISLVGGNVNGVLWPGGQSYSLAPTVNGFVEPLRFRSRDRVTIRGPDWFSAEGATEIEAERSAGISTDLHFADARRVQTLESMT